MSKEFKNERLSMTRVLKELSGSGRRTEQMFYYIEQGTDFESDENCSRAVFTFNEVLILIELLEEAIKPNE